MGGNPAFRKGENPTFHLADDFVALMELKPAERTVYMLLRCNASFGRNAVAEHTVHVTASWFTEMTAHWENPMPASTARRGLNGLIAKNVLIRLNEPQDGSGFAVAFVADPRGQVEGPSNGFAHAKKVSKRHGMKVYYERKDGLPGNPAVTGVRLGRRASQFPRGDETPDRQSPPPSVDEELHGLMDEEYETFHQGPEPEPEFDGDAEPEPEYPDILEEVTASDRSPVPATGVEELTRLLVDKCRNKGLTRQGLLEGEARRLAEACAPSLTEGWKPDQLATRLSSMVSDKIHSTERFLKGKVADLGSPPAAAFADDGRVMIKGQLVDLRSYTTEEPEVQEKTVPEQTAPQEPPAPPSGSDEETRAYLARKARNLRRYF